MNDVDKLWKRNCPNCNRELSYISEKNLNASLKKNKNKGLCLSCSKTGKLHHLYNKPSPKKNKFSSPMVLVAIEKNLIWFNENLQKWCRKCNSCGSEIPAATANKAANRIDCECYSCVAKSRTYSPECRTKMRTSAIKRMTRSINQTWIIPAFNPTACQKIDEYSSLLGYNFRHALNGGEQVINTFSLDGYDSINLIAFEYDEPCHEKKSRKFKDLDRTSKLLETNKVKEIIRYSEKYNKLYKSFPTYSIPL